MPLIGYLLGSTFEKYITDIDHWIAFALLGLLGINMIKEALSKKEWVSVFGAFISTFLFAF